MHIVPTPDRHCFSVGFYYSEHTMFGVPGRDILAVFFAWNENKPTTCQHRRLSHDHHPASRFDIPWLAVENGVVLV